MPLSQCLQCECILLIYCLLFVIINYVDNMHVYNIQVFMQISYEIRIMVVFCNKNAAVFCVPYVQ